MKRKYVSRYRNGLKVKLFDKLLTKNIKQVEILVKLLKIAKEK
jgi:hypothetical protein